MELGFNNDVKDASFFFFELKDVILRIKVGDGDEKVISIFGESYPKSYLLKLKSLSPYKSLLGSKSNTL